MKQPPRRRVRGTIRVSDFATLPLLIAIGSLVASSVGCSSDASRTGGATGGSVGTGGSGNVRHVLKVEMWKAENYFTCASGAACQYRWPATSGETNTAGTSVSAMREGSLLALPATLDITTMGLETEPAKRLAWTLQNYGGYLVDDTAWSVYAIAVETGPDGKFMDQFQQDWGFAFKLSSKATPWGRDMDRLFLALAVVDNNSATSVGGGGTPRQPLAPPFASQ